MKSSTPFSFVLSSMIVFIACTSNSTTQTTENVEVAKQASTVLDSATTNPSSPSVTEENVQAKEEVYLIGWSKDGKILAYRSFALSDAISRHSYISIEVINLVDDKILWSLNKSWDDGNEGEGGPEPSAPTTGEEAWNLVQEEAAIGLQNFDLTSAENLSLSIDYDLFPVQTNLGTFATEVIATEENVKIGVIQNQEKQKIVLEKQSEPGVIVEVGVTGCFINPQQDRVAIIVREMNFTMNNTFYSIIGCSLVAGFKTE